MTSLIKASKRYENFGYPYIRQLYLPHILSMGVQMNFLYNTGKSTSK